MTCGSARPKNDISFKKKIKACKRVGVGVGGDGSGHLIAGGS